MNRRRLLGALGVSVLATGAAPLLAGCTSDGSGDTSPTADPTAGGAAPDPLGAAAVVETALLGAAQDVLSRFPRTSATVQPVIDGHRAHLAALGRPASPTATPSAPAQGQPRSSASALRSLADRERAAAASHAELALGAGPDPARLVASLSAFAAAQDVVLTSAAR